MILMPVLELRKSDLENKERPVAFICNRSFGLAALLHQHGGEHGLPEAVHEPLALV